MTWTDGVLRRVLPNGLTLLVQGDASAPVVAVVTHVRAGYFDEPDEWVGIAHVLEHMYFKGTAQRGPGAIARETQLLGGYINAATIYDKTVYYTVLPSTADGLARALDTQADALMHAALDPGELTRELEVIVQEAKRKLDTPAAVAAESLYTLLFDVHRMRRWRIGTEESLRRLTHDGVRAYHATRYTPDRVIVGIVGDLEPERTADAAAALYEPWRPEPASFEGSPPEPEAREARLRVMHGDVKRPIAELGWRTVGALHPDTPALDVAGTVLGGGRGSRLYRGLRRPGVVASAAASHYSPAEVGVFTVSLEAEGDRVQAGLDGALATVRRLAEDGPTEDEMARAHAILDVQWFKRFEGAEGRATALCEAEALGGIGLLNEWYERERAVTADDVGRVAAGHLAEDAVCAVLYLPAGMGSPIGSAWPPSPAGTAGAGGVESKSVPRRRRGPRGAPTGRRIGGVEHIAFDGTDLLVHPTPGSGLVTLHLEFMGVTAREAAATAGLSWLLARAALRGAAGLDGDALAQAAERLGGGIAPSVGAESMGWGITIRADALGEAAGLLRAVAAEATLDEGEVLVERDLQVSAARRARDDMFRYPLQRVLGQAFPGDPYGLPRLGEPETLQELDPARVREWARDLHRRRTVVVVVGDVAAGEAVGALGPLAGWDGSDAAAVEPAPAWRPGRSEERRRREQTALAMAFPSVPFASDGRYAAIVLGALLSGLAGRLFDELREKRSLAYTVAAMPWLARRAGALLCYIATSPDRESEAREAMLRELRRVVIEPPSEGELARARNYAAGTVEVRRQTGRALAGEILEAWVHGALDTVPELPRRLRGVSMDEVLRVAGALGNAESRAEYVVRGGGDG